MTHGRAAPRDAAVAIGDVERARAALAHVVEVVPHTDADGLAAGAIVLRALGRPADDALLLGRGETPWSPDVAAHDAGAAGLGRCASGRAPR